MNKYLAMLSVALLTTTAFGGKYNPLLDIGDSAPAWKDLPGVDGKKHSLADLKKKEVVVVVFTCNSCPYAVDYEDRLIKFAKKHANSKVGLVAINVNKIPADALPAMKKRAKEKGFLFPYLFDESQKIAKDFGATRTPEFFVLNKARKVVYMGSMDDNSDATKVKKRYLDAAVQASLTGGKIATNETVPIGCSVRFERKRRRKK